MRAVFTVDVRQKDGKFVSSDEIVTLLDSFGFEIQERHTLLDPEVWAIVTGRNDYQEKRVS